MQIIAICPYSNKMQVIPLKFPMNFHIFCVQYLGARPAQNFVTSYIPSHFLHIHLYAPKQKNFVGKNQLNQIFSTENEISHKITCLDLMQPNKKKIVRRDVCLLNYTLKCFNRNFSVKCSFVQNGKLSRYCCHSQRILYVKAGDEGHLRLG